MDKKDKKSILISQIQRIAGIEGVEGIVAEPALDNYMLIHVYFDPNEVFERLLPEEIIARNYKAQLRRGTIKDGQGCGECTTALEFVEKLYEEVHELKMAVINKDEKNIQEELADVRLTAGSMGYHFCYDLQLEEEAKCLYNEIREN